MASTTQPTNKSPDRITWSCANC